MDAVTYPTPEVVQLLSDRFVCLAVNTKKPDGTDKELIRRYRLLWEPGFVVVDHRQTEFRRFVGFRNPSDLAAEVLIAQGKSAYLHLRFKDACKEFRSVGLLEPHAELAAEALFWGGIAAYREQDRNLAVLESEWAKLLERHPDSSWCSRADVLDFEPSGQSPRERF